MKHIQSNQGRDPENHKFLDLMRMDQDELLAQQSSEEKGDAQPHPKERRITKGLSLNDILDNP